MPPATNPAIYRFGTYAADARSGELRKNGVKIKLQEQPFQVLAMLLERPGEVVTREELRQRLWPADTFVDFDHSLNTAINKLRDALGDAAANPRFIETLAKRGYRFIAPVTSEGSEGSKVSEVSGAPPKAEECVAAVARAEAPGAHADLPVVDRKFGRALFALIQVMYLSFYVVSMWKLGAIQRMIEGFMPRWDWPLVSVIVLSAVLGIPTRLYLLAAVLFDFPRLGEKFRRLFPFLFPLDELWALSPFLLVGRIGFGLGFAATAALLYLPFSQRTLMRMTYPPR